MKYIFRLFLLLVISLVSFQVSASHHMGGNITYECVGTNTYAFTLTLYRDCNGAGMPTFYDMNYSSASCSLSGNFRLELINSSSNLLNPEPVTPLCAGELDACQSPGGIYGIEKYVYAYVPNGPNSSSPPLTLPQACSDWIIATPGLFTRNSIISTGAAGNALYIEVGINNVNTTCNNSPTFDFDPVFYGCVGDTVIYGHGVSDIENDSLVFSLTDCLSGNGFPVNYNTPYSATNPLSTASLNLDSETGVLTFVPITALTSVICIKVEEYRNGQKIGEVTRDLQVSIVNCSNAAPTLSGINGTNSNSIDVCANQPATFTFTAFDNNLAQTVAVLNTAELQGATYSTSTNGNITQLTVNWTPTSTDTGKNFLNISLEDNNCPLIGKSNYSFLINVIPSNTGISSFPDSTIMFGNTVNLNLSTSGSTCTINWQANSTLSCTNCFNPIATPTTSTTYYYQVNCGTGNCDVVNDSIRIEVYAPKNISGVVNRSDGNPLNNSKIYFFNSDRNLVDSTITDVLGNYQFINILDTFCYLKAVPDLNFHTNQYTTYYDNTTSFGFAQPINLVTNTVLNFQTRPILQKTLQGTIRDSYNNPLSNSEVILYALNGTPLDTVMTNMTGFYQFNNIVDTLIYVEAIPNSSFGDQARTYHDSTLSFINALPFLINTTTTNLDFGTIRNEYTLNGTVYLNVAGGIVAQNSKVLFYDEQLNLIDSIYTDTLGKFIFTNYYPTIYIKVIPDSTLYPNYTTSYYGNSAYGSFEQSFPLTLFPFTNFLSYNFYVYKKNRIIKGQILRSDGLPLSHSRVNVYNTTNTNLNAFINTDSLGNYRIIKQYNSTDFRIGVVPNYNLHNDQHIVYYDSSFTLSGAILDTLSILDSIETIINFNTLAKSYTVSGLISRSDGQPLTNSKLRIYNGYKQVVDSLTTDNSGNYSYATILDSIYIQAVPNVALHSDQYPTFHNGNTDIFNGYNPPITFYGLNNTKVQHFSTIPYPVVIQGTVTLEDGTLPNSYSIQVYDSTKTFISVYYGNNVGNGNYTFLSNNLNVGDYYYIEVSTNASQSTSSGYYDDKKSLETADSLRILSLNTTGINLNSYFQRTLQGNITTSNGLSLFASKVYAYDTNGNILDSTTTFGNGDYVLNTLHDSLYIQVVPWSGFPNEMATFYTGSIDFANATLITFTNYQATINFTTLPISNVLNGIVSQSNGLALTNSWVYLLDNNENLIDSVQTDATGNYQFITLVDSVYLMVVPNINSELTTYYNNSETFINATLITFPNTQAIVNFSTLPKLNELQGIITNSNGLLSGLASLTLFDVNGNVIANTTADASGNYQFTTIEDSVYLLAASFPFTTPDLPTYYNGSETLANATLITFTNFQATISFSTLPTLNEVEGIVFRSDGLALDNSWIYLLDNNENVIDSVLTDAMGNYEFFTYTDSVYLLAIPNMNDQLPTYYNGSATFANANRITFFTNQVTAHFLTLPKPTTLEGIITRADGLPLDNSWIHLMDNNLVNIDSVQTTVQGNYNFTINNTSIDYYLKATPSASNADQVITYYNNVETIQAADSIPINAIINTVNFSTIDTANATGGKGINGVLYLGVENNPVPVADIRLILKNANGDFINDAITNDVGEFNFYGLDNSAYSIWVDKSGINNAIAPIALASDLSSDTLYFELFDNRIEALINNTNLIINENDISIYPNPVTTELIIEYDLEKAANVNISIIDVQGKQVKSLQNERQNSGKYQIIEKINKNLLPDGIYFILLEFDNQRVTKRVLVQSN